MARLLVVEDQKTLLESLRFGLEEEGYQVQIATTGQDAYHLARRTPFDAVILDLMLPDGDGLGLLTRLRTEHFVKPILIVTARDSVQDRVKGLDRGADDYLIKAFAFSELVARLRALLRRVAGNGDSTDAVLRVADLTMDLIKRQVTRADRELEMTQRQFVVLEYLIRHKNQIVTREMLAVDVWKATTATWTNVIEVQINHLRKKIQLQGLPPLLHTVRGEGYVIGELP
jgi:two-component system copper resistance phosphate regulon response regulator CusR